MSREGSFHIVLRGRALQSLNLAGERPSESEISGSIGNVLDVAAVEGTLLEVKGSKGTIRLSLPPRFLDRFLTRTTPPEAGG